MWTGAYWKASLERAITVAAATFLALVGTAAVAPDGADWLNALIVSLVAAGLSMVKDLAAHGKSGTGPSLVSSEVLAPPAAPPDPSKI